MERNLDVGRNDVNSSIGRYITFFVYGLGEIRMNIKRRKWDHISEIFKQKRSWKSCTLE